MCRYYLATEHSNGAAAGPEASADPSRERQDEVIIAATARQGRDTVRASHGEARPVPIARPSCLK